MSTPRPENAPRAGAGAAAVCWCGSGELVPFSAEYLRCLTCETLRVVRMPDAVDRVTKDEQGLYGKDYWFAHQERDLGYPDIVGRARLDLPERALYWLRTALKYKKPPGRVLELGSSHGGFVALLGWAGFEARGLELSPWVVDYARRTFGVSMLLGRLEDQAVEPGSLDLIALMDVLEHLDRPEATMRRAVELLKPEGVLLIQTPRYPEDRAHEAMVAAADPFLDHLKAGEHLFLFSERSVAELLRRVGAGAMVFEPAIFSQYDMCVVAGRTRLATTDPQEVDAALAATPGGRLVRGLLDLDDRIKDVEHRLAGVEEDRVARLRALERQADELAKIPALRAEIEHAARQLAERQAVIDRQADTLAKIPALRALLEHAAGQLAERQAVIDQQADALARIPGLEADLAHVRAQHEASEADRAARLAVIESQGSALARIPGLEADIAYLNRIAAEQGAVVEDQRRGLEEAGKLLAEVQALQRRRVRGPRERKRLRELIDQAQALLEGPK